MSATVCAACKAALLPEDRFCSRCGQSTARIYWYSSPDVQPREGASVIPEGGTFYLVAQNSGNDAARVSVDASRLRGLRLVGVSEAWVERRQSVAFPLQHIVGESIGGVVSMQSEDGLRPRPSLRDPEISWWTAHGQRQQQYRAQTIVRIVNERWIIGAEEILFPPGVRRQYIRVWNDAERSRTFDTDIPAGYRFTANGVDIDKRAPDFTPLSTQEFSVEALSERLIKEPDDHWTAGPDEKYLKITRMSADRMNPGPDVVLAIDFGTRNTGVRIRWRHELVVGKPRESVDIIGDRQGSPRFPSEMAIHRTGRSFQWGSDVPRGMLDPDVIRIANLKTYLRTGEEPYVKWNSQWTCAYLMERYFEQLFSRIDAYFHSVDPALNRKSLNMRYVLTRPVLDANSDNLLGARYEAALLNALVRNGVRADQIQFMFEPVAAAYSVARNHVQELLALEEGSAIAVVDAGGGTTDVALARISMQNGRLTLQISGAYSLQLDPGNPALPAVQRFGTEERRELGGDVLDYALAHLLLTNASILLETDGRPVPKAIDLSTGVVEPGERSRREAEFVLACRALKEAFAYVSTHHLAASTGASLLPHEHPIFVNRPEYEGVYLEQSLFGEHLIAPILRNPVGNLRESMEAASNPETGDSNVLHASEVKQVFYVGGTNIEHYLRQQIHTAFPGAPRLQAESVTDAAQRISERLNAVVEGAIWCDEALFSPAPFSMELRIGETTRPIVAAGDPLPPESASALRPFLVRLEPMQELDASLLADVHGSSRPVALAHYRNTTEEVIEGTLQLRVSREKGVSATLIMSGQSFSQWRFALVEPV